MSLPLSRLLRTLHTLTIRVGFIDGDHALGLRKGQRNSEEGEGQKTQGLLL